MHLFYFWAFDGYSRIATKDSPLVMEQSIVQAVGYGTKHSASGN